MKFIHKLNTFECWWLVFVFLSAAISVFIVQEGRAQLIIIILMIHIVYLLGRKVD